MDPTGPKVLIIEDDRDARANLADILELDGYGADLAGTVEEALSRSNWGDYAAILLDRRLPDGTSEDLLPRLRERAPHVAILVLTGYGDIVNAIQSLRHGVADYLLKPIDAGALRSSLGRIRRLQEAEARMQQAERLAALGQMMAVVSHESRNALNQIGLCLASLRTKLGGERDLLGTIALAEQASRGIARLFDDIRGYAAPIHLDLEEGPFATILHDTWGLLSAASRGRTVRFDGNSSDMNLTCQVDRFRLGQAFRNLFENALAACPDPMELQVHWSEVERDGQPGLQVHIRDNGPGLAPEQRRKVFEPFYTTKRDGTGLGLAITKRIIEAHGGLIAVGDSGPPGAEFVIWLPRVPRADPSASPTVSLSPPKPPTSTSGVPPQPG